jgi:hypothetical protein
MLLKDVTNQYYTTCIFLHYDCNGRKKDFISLVFLKETFRNSPFCFFLELYFVVVFRIDNLQQQKKREWNKKQIKRRLFYDDNTQVT